MDNSSNIHSPLGVVSNITFVMLPDQRDRFLEWMRGKALAALFNPQTAAKSPRLQQVAEVGGEAPGPEHGLSIALQAEFKSAEEAHQWSDSVLAPVLGEYTREFGPHALFFTTLLEIIPL